VSDVITSFACAKINREIRVGGRRADGFHEIRSRMVSIDVADRLEAGPSDTFDFVCEAPGVPSGESNLVVQAARALAERLGRRPTGRLRLRKSIPVGAGLGGGSADAAAALVLLVRLWNASIDERELVDLAAVLGSDIPFFLTGGEAEISGRGDVVTPLPDEPAADLLLLVAPFSISTREVYDTFDRLTPAPEPVPEGLEVKSSGKFFGRNDLASAVHAVSGQMKTYLRSAREFAAEAGITGSGSTIVLRGATRQATSALAGRHPESTTLKARTLSREEYRRNLFGPGGSAWRSPK